MFQLQTHVEFHEELTLRSIKQPAAHEKEQEQTDKYRWLQSKQDLIDLFFKVKERI